MQRIYLINYVYAMEYTYDELPRPKSVKSAPKMNWPSSSGHRLPLFGHYRRDEIKPSSKASKLADAQKYRRAVIAKLHR